MHAESKCLTVTAYNCRLRNLLPQTSASCKQRSRAADSTCLSLEKRVGRKAPARTVARQRRLKAVWMVLLRLLTAPRQLCPVPSEYAVALVAWSYHKS